MKMSSIVIVLAMAALCERGWSRNLVYKEATTQANGAVAVGTNSTASEVQCTKPCEELSSYSCTLCADMCKNTITGEVTIFNLTTCSLLTCKKWISEPRSEQTPTDTTPKCDEWETKLLSAQECGPSCCNEQFEAFTYDNYEKCIQTNNNQSSTNTYVSAIIAAVLSSSLGFIVFLVIVICCRGRIALCCKNFVFAIQNCFTGEELKKARDPSTDQSQHHQHNQQTPKKAKKIKWESIQNKKHNTQVGTSKFIISSQHEINPEIYCSICLDTGLNTHSHCDHHFHLVCLRKKLAKKLICPECKSKHFNPLKITCDICLQKQTKFHMNKNTADFQLPEFLINNKIYCDDCLKKNIVSGRIKEATTKI